MSQTKYHIPTVYNPQNLSKSELIENFVIRTKEFEQVFHIIKNDDMKNPPQHIIIQGQRGSGKTTLLLRIYYEVTDDAKLKDWLVPIMFNEEQYGIRRLERLWERLADYLEDYSDSFAGISSEMEKIIDEYKDEEKCFEMLMSYLQKGNRKLVLFIDNFGEMVRKFKEKEIKRLREILMTSPDIRLIAGSSTVMEFNYDYSLPFYEFFKVFQLKGLNKDETIGLLLKLGESYKAKKIKSIVENEAARIESLRRLTSGVPRTIVLLFDIFVDNENGNAFRDLEMTLDAVTPLYKHRMDDLPAQQQEIVEAIALNWDAISVKEIAQITRMESKAISAQLKLLTKNKVIEKEPTSTKNHLYRLHERFFNIWYLMRYGGRKHRDKVKFLVKFLEIWCSEKELLNRANKHLKAISGGQLYEKQALYMTEALAQTSISSHMQDELIKETRKYLKNKESGFADELSHSDLEIYSEIIKLLDSGDEQVALRKVQETRNEGEALMLIGFIYQYKHKDNSNAEKYYMRAIETSNVGAMNNLAVLFQMEYKNYKKAEEYYLKAIELGYDIAMNNLAFLYEREYKDYKKAKEYYLKAIKLGNRNGAFNLALLYENKYQDYEKAKLYYLKAIEVGDSKAMFNLALLYEEKFKDYKKAEEYYLKAIQVGDAGAMNNIALLYYQKYNNNLKAEEYYLKAIESGHTGAMNNLAFLYKKEYNDYNKAEEYFSHAIEVGDSRAMNDFAWMLFENKSRKKEALQYAQDSVKVKKEFPNLHTLVTTLLWNDEIENAINVWEKELYEEEHVDKWKKEVAEVLSFFIAKKQYNFVYKLFQNNKFEIKEKYKPVYYALLSCMGEKYSDEYKKMGPELKETVDEIIENIEQLRKDYN